MGRIRTGVRLGVVMATGAVVMASFWLTARFEASPGLPSETGVMRRNQAKGPSTLKLAPQKGKIALGIFEPGNSRAVTEFEQQIGREADVVSIYQAWGGENRNFDAGSAEYVAGRGKTLLVTWEPWRPSKTDFDQPEYRLRRIAEGQYDEYLRVWFTQVKAWNKPIFVRFAHEMNGNWYPWGPHVNQPQDYIDAWRHVVDVSREVGAKNITWVWAPNEQNGSDDLGKYYPGSKYVDWVGLSGFNWGNRAQWQTWRRFNDIYGADMKQLRKYKKPIMIAEIASVENPDEGVSAQSKNHWIREAFAEIKKANSSIGLVVWFNDTFTQNSYLFDWRVASSPTNIPAMKEALSDEVYSGNLVLKRAKAIK